MKDNLNNFFKKNLEDYTPDASWNVPDDDIFLEAIEAVNKESKPDRKYIFLLFLVGCITALTVFELSRQNEIDTLQNIIVSLEDRIDELKHHNNEETADHKKVVNSNKSLAQNIEDKSSLPDILNKKTSIGNTISNYQYLDTEIALLEPVVEQKVDILINGAFKKVTPSFITSLLTKPTDLKKKTFVSHEVPLNHSLLNINQIPRLLTSVFGDINYNSIYLLPSIISKEKIEQRKWSIGAALINNVSWLSMTNVPAASENALTAYDQTHHCKGIKLSAGYKLNKKWSVYGDLGYEGFQNQSDLNTDFFYDESQVNSDEIFETQIELINPLGDFSSMASFRVRASMDQNDVIVEEAKIKQTLNALTLKSGINYTVFEGRKLFGKVGLGIGVAAITKLNNEFKVSLYNDNELMTSYTEETAKMKGVNTFFIMAEAKATIGYKLSSNFNFNLESAYNRSLSSLRDSAPASGPQTYLHALSVSTGISYNF